MKEEHFHKVQVQYLMLNWFFLRERTSKSGPNFLHYFAIQMYKF